MLNDTQTKKLKLWELLSSHQTLRKYVLGSKILSAGCLHCYVFIFAAWLYFSPQDIPVSRFFQQVSKIHKAWSFSKIKTHETCYLISFNDYKSVTHLIHADSQHHVNTTNCGTLSQHLLRQVHWSSFSRKLWRPCWPSTFTWGSSSKKKKKKKLPGHVSEVAARLLKVSGMQATCLSVLRIHLW